MGFPITLRLRRILISAIVSLTFLIGQLTYLDVRAQTAKPAASEKPFVVEYYYKAKWGFAGEFIRLFKRNHYPYLKKQMELGNILQITAESPIYHATESERWDYRVRLVWKNVEVANDDSDQRILKQLFPDQETFNREEQRRFEILLAHWDVPIKAVNLDEK